METVRIDARSARALREGHPWVYSNQVRQAPSGLQAGEVVRVTADGSGAGRDLGTAIYNAHSLMALRHLSFEGEDLSRTLLARRLAAARALRERAFPGSTCHRLCHGEADRLPGLFIDRYGDTACVQASSAGMDRVLPEIADVLAEEHGLATVIERDDTHARSLEGLPPRTGVLRGAAPGVLVVDLPPVRLHLDPLGGQKTGSFLDQRENRVAAARWGVGRAVFEAHCNVGGFSLVAAVAGAASVLAIDSSAEAVELARRAAADNGVADRCRHEHGDALDVMDACHRRRERFGMVVVDPPSYTRSRKHVPQARQALREVNRRAITLVEPGGVLVSSSCSHHVREDTFLELVRQAAAQAGRRLVVLEVRYQSPDHPYLPSLPDSRYLKCLIALIE